MVRFYDGEKEAAFTEGVKTEKKKYSWSKMTETIEKVSCENGNTDM